MITKMFAVYDSKAGAFGPPLCFVNTAVATRWFSDKAKNENDQIAKHPEDYSLFLLGEYTDENANLNLLTAPQSLGLASEFIVRN